MSWRSFGEALITLVVILDPLGGVPVFLSLTRNMSTKDRNRAAYLAMLVATTVILVFALFGQLLLDYLNVSLEALMIAGGILLFIVALEMLRGAENVLGSESGNVALVPLGTPLLAGPGAIVATMVLFQQHPVDGGRLGVLLGIVAALLVVLVALRAAAWVNQFLRPSAIHFMTRIMGLLLTAIAIQLIADAIFRWIQIYR